SSSQIDLSWAAATDNVGVAGYRLERSQGAGSSSYAQVATPSGTTFTDSGLSASTVYNYRVRSADAVGNLSGYSAVATATTANPPPDTAPPTVPTALVGAPMTADRRDRNWTATTAKTDTTV